MTEEEKNELSTKCRQLKLNRKLESLEVLRGANIHAVIKKLILSKIVVKFIKKKL